MLGWMARILVFRSQICVLSGRNPVRMLARDGPQTACWQCALVNVMPWLASLSMFGDFTMESP